MWVVTTLSDPPRGGAAPRPRPPAPPAYSQLAAEKPCHPSSPAGGAALPKCSSRVCVPASDSILSVVSLSQVRCRRPGTRMIAPAPYDLHWLPAASSLAGSQASATLRASALSGTLA